MKNYFINISLVFSLKQLVFTGLFLLLTITLNAQEKSRRLEKADDIFNSFGYIDARAIYLDVVERGYKSANLYAKLADSYYFTGELDKSTLWYQTLIEEFPQDLDPEYYFRYSQSLKSNKQYDLADEVMARFSLITGKDRRAVIFSKNENYLEFIDKQSGKFEVAPLNINSEFSEYAPSFDHNNNVVFASSKAKLKKNSKVHSWNKMPFLDLYASKILDDTLKLGTPSKLPGKINTPFHESSSTFTRDGKTMYFSRNNYSNKKLKKNKKGVVLLKSYRATLKGGVWTDITELPFCSDHYSVSHPSVNKEGTKLYFASDMPGSYGKSDLYVVDILEGNRYGKPRNLGNNINTEGRETFPFISSSGKLYFASDGLVGLGGLDIFISEPDYNNFNSPINVGKPINSPKDDFSLVINDKTQTGYFASNRDGGKGNDDIYGFKQKNEIITQCKQYLEVAVFDIKTKEPLPNAKLNILDQSDLEIFNVSTNSEGKYDFNVECDMFLTINASYPGYLAQDATFETSKILEHENKVSIYLEKKIEEILPQIAEVKFGDDLSKILQLNPIYFNLDNSEIKPEAEEELQKIISALKKYPKLNISVHSHTDSRSSFWYNKKLSVKRMRTTIAYLVEKGNIYWRRILGKAYGERRLINKCADGVPCTEEEHQENRRSEFIVR